MTFSELLEHTVLSLVAIVIDGHVDVGFSIFVCVLATVAVQVILWKLRVGHHIRGTQIIVKHIQVLYPL